MLQEHVETERLLLHRASIDDAPELFERYTADPKVVRYLPWPPHANLDVTREFLQRKIEKWDNASGHAWTVRLRQSGQVIGMIEAGPSESHRVSFGYVFAVEAWGKGYATEAARVVVEVLGQLPQVQRIWATCDIDNHASARVLEKAGLVREGLLHRWDYHNVSPDPRDLWIYATWRDTDGSWTPP